MSLLTRQGGNSTFAEVLGRLRCKRCGGRPAPVYFCAGQRTHNGGAAADWAVELVAVER